jgi:integrase
MATAAEPAGMLPPYVLGQTFARAAKAAGFPKLSFHATRHTHATLMLQRGMNVKVLAARLGHADVAITLRTYAHVMPAMEAQAAETAGAILEAAENYGSTAVTSPAPGVVSIERKRGV